MSIGSLYLVQISAAEIYPWKCAKSLSLEKMPQAHTLKGPSKSIFVFGEENQVFG